MANNTVLILKENVQHILNKTEIDKVGCALKKVGTQKPTIATEGGEAHISGCIKDGERSSGGGLTGTATEPLLGAEHCKGLVLNERRKGHSMGQVSVEEMNESEPVEDISKVIRSYQNRECVRSLDPEM